MLLLLLWLQPWLLFLLLPYLWLDILIKTYFRLLSCLLTRFFKVSSKLVHLQSYKKSLCKLGFRTYTLETRTWTAFSSTNFIRITSKWLVQRDQIKSCLPPLFYTKELLCNGFSIKNNKTGLYQELWRNWRILSREISGISKYSWIISGRR